MKAIYTFLLGCFCVGVTLAQSDIARVEYYFDTDPGIGNGTRIDVTDVADLDSNFSIPTTGLSVGTHRLFLRVKNTDNTWSFHTNRTFRLSEAPMTNGSDIVEAEYYFNTDPGFGNGTTINVTDVASLDENFLISTSSLPKGTHRLFIRVKNANNLWSNYTNKVFRISEVPDVNGADIVEAEYYFNTDPGFGNGTNINVADVASLDENFLISTSSLPKGTHRLFIRVKNTNNLWSVYTHKIFRISDVPVTNAADIVEAEYYFDVDPGIGSGTVIDVTDIASLDEDLLIATGALSVGTHRLFLRVKNSNDLWSMYTNKTFRVSDMPSINAATITAAEYFIDVDPGFGNGTAIALNGDAIDSNLIVTTTRSLAQGDHFLHMRVLNADGKWSFYGKEMFQINGTLGVDSDVLTAVKIYPNPTSGLLQIRLPDGNQITKIALYDMNGRQVFLSKQNLQNIDMSALQNGIYLLQLDTDKGSVSKKIIKK